MHSFARLTFLFLVFLQTVFGVSQSFVPGVSVFDSTGYVEYIPGNLPVVISVPHGGYLTPANIPDRNCSGCVYVRDAYTQELAREIRDAFYQKTGCYPHMIINLLHRKKFDANRDIGDAADGNPIVESCWYAYHAFIDSAKAKIVQDYSRGLFIDLHGHGHSIQRLELGYLIYGSTLRGTDSTLNMASVVGRSSIRALIVHNLNLLNHAELIRGPNSFGGMIERKGFDAVPSDSIPYPLSGEYYFSGGYNTQRHGASMGGKIDGIQIECNRDIRYDTVIRKAFADTLRAVINAFINYHYFSNFQGNYCNIISNIPANSNTTRMRVFPNPAQDILYIQSEFQTLEIIIYNSLGQSVKHLKLHGNTISTGDLSKGYYIIFIKHNNQIILKQKLIIM